MNLESYKDYRSEAMMRICNNDYIRELLINNSPDKIDPSLMVGEYVFPFEYLPDVTETAKSFVTMHLATPVVDNGTVVSSRIILYISCHKDLMFVVAPDGNITYSTSLPEGTVTINNDLFLSTIHGVTSHVFRYNAESGHWVYNSKDVNISDYGINVTGSPSDGDLISVDVSGKKYLRYDIIAEEIDKLFNGSLAFGFKLSLVSRKDGYQPIYGFHGTMLVYETKDWNRRWPSRS